MSGTAVEESAELAALLVQIDEMVGGAYDGQAARRHVETGTPDRAAWRRLAHDLGLVGLHLPEAVGGQGQPFACTAAVASALGRRLAPSPHLGALGPAVRLLGGAPAAVRGRFLVPLLDGSRIVAVAGLERGIDGPRAALDVDAGTATGRLPAVVDAGVADVLLAVTDRAVLVLDLAADGVRVAPVDSLDLTRGRAAVELTAVPVEVVDVTSEDVHRAVVEATCLLAAESVAGAEACLAASLDYARLRTQFGRPIGAFQALQHSLVDLFGDVASARAAVDVAVGSVEEHCGGPAAVEDVRVAAVAASEAYRQVARANVHVHGGIGFTWEHDAHLHLRRALTDRPLLGDPVSHRRALGRMALERAR